MKEHRKIIEEYVVKGFVYKGYLPTHQGASGKTVELDLIFETEV